MALLRSAPCFSKQRLKGFFGCRYLVLLKILGLSAARLQGRTGRVWVWVCVCVWVSLSAGCYFWFVNGLHWQTYALGANEKAEPAVRPKVRAKTIQRPARDISSGLTTRFELPYIIPKVVM